MPSEKERNPNHDYLQVIKQVCASKPDLKDIPLQTPDEELFTDGSSFVVKGERRAGYAVATLTEDQEVKASPPNTSAQKAEIIALTKALNLAKGKRVNIYTDSKYAFRVVHAHGAIWKERGLLSASGTPIKYGTEILNLLEAVQKLKEVAVIHCKVHQRRNSKVIQGN